MRLKLILPNPKEITAYLYTISGIEYKNKKKKKKKKKEEGY
jgi:hypothetical protein